MAKARRVPETIPDKQWAALSARAHRANPDLLSAEVVRRRLASTAQRGKAVQS